MRRSSAATPIRRRLVASCAAALLATGIGHAQPADRATAEAADGVREMATTAGAAPRVTLSPRGTVRFLRAVPGAPIPIPGLAPEKAAAAGAENRARAFLRHYGTAFGLDAAAELAVHRAPVRDALGIEHVHLRQTVDGVPVTAGEIAVHLAGDRVVAAQAELAHDLEGVATTPTVSPAAARQAVHAMLEARRDVRDAELSTPRLEILDRDLLEDFDRGFRPRLAWFVEARGRALREYVWVDATDGSVVFAFSQLPHALERRIHDADSGSTLPGTLVRSEGDGPSGDADVDAAYDFSGDTYDYFFTAHGRDSYDDLGTALVSTVDYCDPAETCPFANAFWDGVQMVYGAGFSLADDVDAHELTHAVTEHTANLFYYMQSGALNESFSDIFGETVDLGNGAGDDSAGARWLMGEDLPGFGALRDMEDPTVFGDPAKVSDTEFHCAASDNGGVHVNSGVPNRAYSLMVDGGTFNGMSVSGIGLEKAGKVQYRALSQYLLSGSDFQDAYDALLQSCADLVGTAGITAGDCAEVEKALDAVEMTATSPCAPALHEPIGDLCAAGEEMVELFHEDFESGDAAWTKFAAPDNWLLATGFATSGAFLQWGQNPDSSSDKRLVSPTVTLPAGATAYLQFAHAYAFEDDLFGGLPRYWDGGVLEVNVDNGGFSDAGGLISAGAAYNGTLVSPNASNVLAGRPGFAGDSFGYVETRADLSSLAGHDVEIRFRLGTDGLVGDRGWFVDDVRVYTCFEPTVFADGFESGDTSLWD